MELGEDTAGAKRAAEDAGDGAPDAKVARVDGEPAVPTESATPASGLEEASEHAEGGVVAQDDAQAGRAPQEPLDATAGVEAGQASDALVEAPAAAAAQSETGEEPALVHESEAQAAQGDGESLPAGLPDEAAAAPVPEVPSAESEPPAAELVVQEEETAKMDTEDAVDDDATQRELAAVQQLQTDETLDREEDPTGGQHQEMSISSDGAAQGVDGTTQALAHSDAADASEDAKVAEQHDEAKRAASIAEESMSQAQQMCPQEQGIKSEEPPADSAGADAAAGGQGAEAAQAPSADPLPGPPHSQGAGVETVNADAQGGAADADGEAVGALGGGGGSVAAAAPAAAAKEENGGGGGAVVPPTGDGTTSEGVEGGAVVKEEGGVAVKEEGGVAVKEEGGVAVKAEADGAGGAAEGGGEVMRDASIGALVNADVQSVPPPPLPPPGVSSAMANAAGEGYVVHAPIPGANKGQELKKQLKETDALEYLNLVKMQFGDSPEIYNKFLDIMKDFKSHAIDTQKVIERVSKLFAGHQRLILGFNTFLPAGYKIEVRNPQKAAGGAMNKKAPAPEFDHAYSYVSKIKQRFSNQQDVYQRFLQILQRYKEEGFAIGHVKQQVAQLFKGHEDLLGEFSNFLPEPGAQSDKLPAAQKGGKKKGGVGNKGSMQSLASLMADGNLDPAQKEDVMRMLSMSPQALHNNSLLAGQPQLLKLLQERQQLGGKGGQGGGAGKGAEGEGKGKKGKKSGADAAAPEVHKEAVLLEKLKKKLMVMGDKCYMDFLKCLGLYVQDVLTANELVTVLEDMMGAPDVRDVFDELKLFLGIRDGPATKYRFNVPISEIDFANCPHSGISYRSLPRDYPLPTCTGRTELCDQTLNDEWVSVPSGSEDFSYTHYRKNQYEESLFKCEDDRYELDMLIETNASTMRIMQAILEEADKDRSRTQKINLNPLKAVHLKAVERVYGDHGAEMVDHLKRAPRLAIGIVLPRLKHKDEEWRKARRDMNKIWRDVYKDNYYKSLDHRSFYFKQVDKKSLHPKHFLYEMHKTADPAPAAGQGAVQGPVHHCQQPCMTLPMDRQDVHKDILTVLSKAAAAELLEGAEARVGKFLSLFLHVLLNLKERCPEELKTSARAWSKRDRKADADAPGAEKGDKRRGKGKAGGKDDGDKDNKDAMDGDGSKEEQDDGADKTDKGDGDDDKDKMDEDDEDGEEEEEEESDDDQDDLWQAVHAQSPYWLPLRCLRQHQSAAESGAHAEEDAGADAVSGAGAARRDAEEDAGLWRLKLNSGVKVFYGNFSCYVFFRLYEKLYQRLLNAKQLAQLAQEAKDESKGDAADAEMNDADADAAAAAAAAVGDEDRNAGGKDKVVGETVYEQFMAMLLDLVEGHLDTSKFEDDCRMLLGTNSYELYTLEKLVEKLLAQVQHLTSDTSQQSASKLLALHEYEHVRASRETLDDLAAPHLAEYMRNAACLTGEEGCFGFYFDTGTRALSIVLHDIKDSGKSDKAERRREDGLDDLLEAVDITRAAEDRERLPYLHRNIQSAARAAASQRAAGGGDEDAGDVADRMCLGVENVSKLELKLSEDRLAYCPHTTDLLHRAARCRVPAEFAGTERGKRVMEWQEVRLTKIPAEAEEERRRRKEEEEEEEEEERRRKEEDDQDEKGDDEEEEEEGDNDRGEEAAEDAMDVDGKEAEESGEEDAGDEEDSKAGKQGKSEDGGEEATGGSDEDRAASAVGKAQAADADNMDEDLEDSKPSANEGMADDGKEDAKDESDPKATPKESGGKPAGRRSGRTRR